MTQVAAWWLTKAQLHCALKRMCWIQPVGFSFCTVLRWDLADLRLRRSNHLIVPVLNKIKTVFYFGVCDPDTRTADEAGQEWWVCCSPALCALICPSVDWVWCAVITQQALGAVRHDWHHIFEECQMCCVVSVLSEWAPAGIAHINSSRLIKDVLFCKRPIMEQFAQ